MPCGCPAETISGGSSRTGGRGSVRPQVVLQEMYGEYAEGLEVRRERLLVEAGGTFVSPLEIDCVEERLIGGVQLDRVKKAVVQ